MMALTHHEANGDHSPEELLRLLHQHSLERRRHERERTLVIRHAREAGVTWSEIAETLGISIPTAVKIARSGEPE